LIISGEVDPVGGVVIMNVIIGFHVSKQIG